MSRLTASLVWALSTTLVLASPMTLQLSKQTEPSSEPTGVVVNWGDSAEARSSAGRVRSGSFSSGSRSSGSSSSSSGSRSSSQPSSTRSTQPSYSTPNRSSNDRPTQVVPVPVPVPVGPGYNNPSTTSPATSPAAASATPSSSTDANVSDADVWLGLIILLVFLGVSLAVFIFIVKLIIHLIMGGRRENNGELENDQVTVTKLQVALLATGGQALQAKLSQVASDLDTETPAGRLQLLQEAALALLRSPESWSHVLAYSETVRGMDQAQTVFEKLSIEERSKFSAETLVKVQGGVRRQVMVKPDADEGPAAYVVVTLLLGTAHDQPLLEEVKSTEALEKVLIRLGALQEDYLMVFELLWSPQDASDSLTYDELLTEYTDMRPIA